MNTACVQASTLSNVYPQVVFCFKRNLCRIRGLAFSILTVCLFQIWQYVREHDPAIFYYAPNDSDRTLAPAGLPIVTANEISHLMGPALLYKRRIIVCTHKYNDIPNSESLILVRLQNR